MMNLIRARVPSLVVFGSVQAVFWGFVYSQWRETSDVKTPLKSAIPQGYIGRSRFEHAYQLGHAHAAA